jgi:hypothetical protein
MIGDMIEFTVQIKLTFQRTVINKELSKEAMKESTHYAVKLSFINTSAIDKYDTIVYYLFGAAFSHSSHS